MAIPAAASQPKRSEAISVKKVPCRASRPKMTKAGTMTRAGSVRAVRQAILASSSGCSRCRTVPPASARPAPRTGSDGADAPSATWSLISLRSCRSEPVAHEVEEAALRVEGAENPWISIQAMTPGTEDEPVGSIEGHLGEPGLAEPGPDARRGVRRPPVPGPDDVAPPTAERRQRTDGRRDVLAADVPE